jgi:hypothetical protein
MNNVDEIQSTKRLGVLSTNIRGLIDFTYRGLVSVSSSVNWRKKKQAARKVIGVQTPKNILTYSEYCSTTDRQHVYIDV